MNTSYSVVVIGAGQAGLVMGYYLKTAGVDYVILGKERRIGDVWRNRYDSLVLFTPRWFSRLPSQSPRSVADSNGYSDKNEIADELEAYAADHKLNVRLGTEVIELKRKGDGWIIGTDQGAYTANHVVIATGPFQQPYTPDFAAQLSSDVFQIHTAHYKNREQLREGNVLIVGSGNSGAQIAMELAGRREVHMSASKPILFLPQELLGKSMFWWFQKLGLYKANMDTKIGQRISKRGDPIIGNGLRAFIRSGMIKLHGRTMAAVDHHVNFEDGDQLQVSNVIWATGFRSDYSWAHVPDVLDDQNRPRHVRGVSPVRGIYFLGLPWQYNRGSALIGGVAADARFLLQRIVESMLGQRAE